MARNRGSQIKLCIVLVRNGYEVKGAFDIIGEARGVAVPDTEAQRDWVTAFLSANA